MREDSGRLAGKVALVTGAGAKGDDPGWRIGAATAVALAREGASVACLDRDAVAAEVTAGLVRDTGAVAMPVVADVGDADAVKQAVREVQGALRRIDVLVNGVGIIAVGGPIDLDEADWNHVLNVNLTGMFRTCKHVLPLMLARGGGAIVNISSIGGTRWTGIPYPAYASSKAGVVQFTRSVALQHARDGIRANAVLPGLMDTPMVRESLRDAYGDVEAAEMMGRRDVQCPTGKMGTAWDVANAVTFLASPEARYVTGTELVVDGGLSASIPGA